jgi:hypothetical protein
MAFWTELNPSTSDPKRNFRFRVSFAGTSQFTAGDSSGIWYAKKVSQPSITVSDGGKHEFLIHTFYWPGKVTWNEIEMTLVDPVTPHASKNFLKAISDSGFVMPGNTAQNNAFKSVSKSSAAVNLGTVLIEQIDNDGNAIHKWTLQHAWAKEISFSTLDYGSEDLSEITLKLRYDWAEFTSYANGQEDAKLFTPGGTT